MVGMPKPDGDSARIAYYGARLAMVVMVTGAGIGLGGVIGFATGSTVVLSPGERAVYTSGGEYNGVVDNGIHPGVPMLDRYRVFDMRHNVVSMDGSDNPAVNAVTADNINVQASVEVRWNIENESDLGYIYRNVAKSQDELREKVVKPAVSDASRTCANPMRAEEVISTNRTDYKQCIRDTLQTKLDSDGIEVITISVVDMDYNKDLAQKFREQKSLEIQKENAKKRVEIAREESRAKVVRAENEGDAEVIRARKKAEAAQLLKKQLDDEYLRYVYITEGLANGETVYVVPSDGSVSSPVEMPVDATATTNSTAP